MPKSGWKNTIWRREKAYKRSEAIMILIDVGRLTMTLKRCKIESKNEQPTSSKLRNYEISGVSQASTIKIAPFLICQPQPRTSLDFSRARDILGLPNVRCRTFTFHQSCLDAMSEQEGIDRSVPKPYYALIVVAEQTKAVKTALESQSLLNKTIKITRREDGRMLLPLTIEAFHATDYSTCIPSRENLDTEHELKLSTLIDDDYDVIIVTGPCPGADTICNPLQHALNDSIGSLPSSSPAKAFFTAHTQELKQDSPKLYIVYHHLLLLPVNFPGHSKWVQFLEALRSNPNDEHNFYSSIACRMQVTHIAKNEPIAAKTLDNAGTFSENLIRSPSNIQPLFGDFGAELPAFPEYIPSKQDFDEAFWVSTYQNGITQIWAPRYTMFSGGNVTEKARILDLPSVKSAVQQGRSDGRGCTAVDLFSGIGYFAFSYAKAGVSKVLCWDLNPWSIEGLKHGAEANKWSCYHLVDVTKPERTMEDIITTFTDAAGREDKFVLFCETNELARDRVKRVRDQIPPIRHVNCGMLPTTGEAWKTAIDIIDPDLGGWIHVHESLHAKDATSCAGPYIKLFQDHFNSFALDGTLPLQIKLENTFRVKSMGPRLWHHVFDFWIPARHH